VTSVPVSILDTLTLEYWTVHIAHLVHMLLQTRQKRPKNRLPMKDGGLQRRSAFSVRLFLKEFCVEFLNGAYNTLMYHVKVFGAHT
jgi:hypothetical protein